MMHSSYNKGKENASKVNEVKKPEVDKGKLKEDVEKLDEKIGKVDTDIPSAFKQKEFASSYEVRITQTPADVNVKVGFEGNRGESLCSLKPPPDPELKQILDQK